MGEKAQEALQLQTDKRLRLEFHLLERARAEGLLRYVREPLDPAFDAQDKNARRQ